MADFVFNVAKGKHAYYATLPGTNDALIGVLLKSSGVDTDATMKDLDTLTAVTTGSDEADFTGYSRITLASVTSTVDDTGDKVTVDAADPSSITNTGTSQAVAKLVICYDPDTTAGDDDDLIPLYGLDCAVTFDTDVAVTLSFSASGIGVAQEAS